MKTRELIAALQAADPEGESEVLMGHDPILGLAREPGYHDGHYMTLERDGARVVSATARRDGWKVRLYPFTLDVMLETAPDFRVLLHESLGSQTVPIAEAIEWERAEVKKSMEGGE